MKNRFWGRNFDFWKKFKNSFWGCRVVEKHSLGSGKWFGTTLDHLGCITCHFTEKKFLTFFRFFPSIFQRNFAYFWRIWAVQVAKNRFFFKNKPCMKNPLVEKLDMVPYFILLASLEKKSKNERQVSFWNQIKIAFLSM